MSPRDLKLLPSVGGAVKKLSHLFRTPRQPLSHTRTSNPSPFTAVPFDVAEEILLYLPGQDIIRMKQVNHSFADLISTSSLLKYRLDAFAAGLIENPHIPCSPEEGQRRVKQYVDMWENFDAIKRRNLPLRQRYYRWCDAVVVGGDLITRRSRSSFSFLRLSSTSAGQQDVEEWAVDPVDTPYQPRTFTLYPPENVLALVELMRPAFRIRLLDVRDGSPHHLPLNNVITWDADLDDKIVTVPYADMTASRLMIFISTSAVDVLIVWDWRIGNIVLKWSSVEYNFLRLLASKLVFVDEFRLLATMGVPVLIKNTHELDFVMFDTSIPQQSSDSWQPFDGVPTYHRQYPRNRYDWDAYIYTDRDRRQGEGSRDEPLIVDPSQSVVVISLEGFGAFLSGETILVFRTTALVGYMPSTRTCRRILWDEWKRDLMVMKVPPGIIHSRIIVFGSRILLATRKWQDDSREGHRVHAYNFSRWGCKALVKVGSGEEETMLVLTPEKIWCPDDYSDRVGNMRALGDSIVSCGVSNSLAYLQRTECLHLV